MMVEPEQIREKALDLGYEACGIIGIHGVEDYLEKLQGRIKEFPESAPLLERHTRFIHLENQFPWAKSIVVCLRRYGKYAIPAHLEGLIAKYYLVDSRTDEQSPDYQGSAAFEDFLQSLGMQTASDRKFGITALRWAASKAGLGVIRKNNFFYTPTSGSWVYIEAWLIDKSLELTQGQASQACPKNCRKCLQACPTQSLCSPYSMDQTKCMAYLTAWGAEETLHNRDTPRRGKWVFGCDACQDVCPFNANQWEPREDFPGLQALAEHISLEKILAMDEGFLQKVMAKKFWYIPPNEAYRWKINALNAMFHNYHEGYLPFIDRARGDRDAPVRQRAERIREALQGAAGGAG